MVELTWNTPNQNAINDHRLTQPESTSQNLSLTGTHLKVVEQVRHILVPFRKYKFDILLFYILFTEPEQKPYIFISAGNPKGEHFL